MGWCTSHKGALGHKNHTQENQTPQDAGEDMLSDIPFQKENTELHFQSLGLIRR